MSRRPYQGVEDARNQFPSLIDAAANGKATVITRRGRPVAALVPLEDYVPLRKQQSLLPLQGSGTDLWGTGNGTTLRKLRDEWNR